MEDKVVFMTAEKIEERRSQIAAIEGLSEIRAAIKDQYAYFQAKMAFERGDLVDVPQYKPYEVENLKKKYPRAAAYLEAELWIYSQNPVKVRLASRALDKILDGEDPEAVIQEMSKGLDAFFLAQEG